MESEAITSRSSYNALQRTYQDQSQRLAECHANIHTLTNALAKQKTENRLELERIMAQNALLEKYSNEARDTVQDREAELEQMSESFAEKERAAEEQISRLEADLAQAKKRADDFKFALDRLATANDASLDISPTATIAAKQAASGKSIVQLWTENVRFEDELNEANLKNEQLQRMVRQIQEEIMEKVGAMGRKVADARNQSSTSSAGTTNRSWSAPTLSRASSLALSLLATLRNSRLAAPRLRQSAWPRKSHPTRAPSRTSLTRSASSHDKSPSVTIPTLRTRPRRPRMLRLAI